MTRRCWSSRTRSRSPTHCPTCCVGRGTRSRSQPTGTEALDEFERSGADIVLLDLMLPGMSGTEVCRATAARSNVPIIMVTARDSEMDKVVGLELGADDYVTKPFSSRELVARIRAVLRRGAEPEELPPTSSRPGRSGWTSSGTWSRSTVCRWPLPLKEFDLLELLLRNSGRVLTRGQLIDRVWGADYVGDTKTLDVHVKRLRAKIEPDPANPKYLVTVRGLGYKFERSGLFELVDSASPLLICGWCLDSRGFARCVFPRFQRFLARSARRGSGLGLSPLVAGAPRGLVLA